MDFGALFLTLLTVVLVLMFVVWPLRKHKFIQMDGGQEISALLAERDRVLKEIQELDFDNSLGKIPPDEYSIQRKALLQLGVDVLRHIDSLNHSIPVVGIEGSQAESILLQAAGGKANLISDEDLEELIAKRRTILKEKTGGFCPKCGKPFLVSDKFCSCCGEPVGIRP